MIKKHLFNVSKLNSNASKLALIAALSASSISYASAPSTYVGIDAVFSKMGFKQNYGENIFSKKVTPGVNVFVGHMFTEHFGAELGYEVDKKMKRTATIYAGEYLTGVHITPGAGLNWASFNTTLKQSHPYLGFIAKTNVFGDNSYISLMLGMAVSNITAKYHYFKNDMRDANDTKNFSKTKPIAIARIAYEYKFNDKFGLRTILGWKNTSAFKVSSKENLAAQIKLKDSFNFGVGASYYIL